MVRLGIIGFGGMGHWHFEHASTVEGVKFVAAHDIDRAQLDDARRLGLKAYEKLDDFLGDPEIDAVLVSASNVAHRDLVIAVANAKKPIICEKPAALTVADFDLMCDAAKKNDVVFTVHQNRRWDKDFRTVKQVMEDGLVGKVFHISSRLYSIFGYVHGWHRFPDQGGGMIYDWGVHLIDQIIQLVPSEPVSIWADIKNVINEKVDDYFKLLFRFENGLFVEIELGTYMLDIFPRWYVAGDTGTAIVKTFAADGEILRTDKERKELPNRIGNTFSGPTRTFVPISPEDFIHEELPKVPDMAWTEFYKNFVDVIENAAEPIVKLPQVRLVLRIIEMARESARIGREVVIPR